MATCPARGRCGRRQVPPDRGDQQGRGGPLQGHGGRPGTAGPAGPARVRCSTWPGARDDPAFGTLGRDLLASSATPWRRQPRFPAGRDPRRRRPDRCGHRPTHAVRCSRTSSGRTSSASRSWASSPRSRARSHCSSSARTGSTSSDRRTVTRVARAAAQPATGRGGSARAAHQGADRARHDAHPRHGPPGFARRRPRGLRADRRHPAPRRGAARRARRRTGRSMPLPSGPRTSRTRSRTRSWLATPASVREREGGRTRGRGHRSVLHPEVVAGCATARSQELDAPFSELVEQAFLYPFDFLDQGFYDFRHQLLRDALYGVVPPSELRRLHARAADFGGADRGRLRHPCAASISSAPAFGRRRTGRPWRARRPRAPCRVAARRSSCTVVPSANLPDDLSAAEKADLYEAYCEAAYAIDDVPAIEATARLAREHNLAAGRRWRRPRHRELSPGWRAATSARSPSAAAPRARRARARGAPAVPGATTGAVGRPADAGRPRARRAPSRRGVPAVRRSAPAVARIRRRRHVRYRLHGGGVLHRLREGR